MHGRDRTAEEMLELAARFEVPGYRWVAPAADVGSWYPHRFHEPVPRNQPFLSQALQRCEDAMDNASEANRLAADRLAIVGFSQGACVASEYVLLNPDRCRALIMFTGSIIGPDARVEAWRESGSRLEGLKVLITGSDVDEWVPESRVRETADVLAALGAEVRMRLYPGRDHVVSDEEIEEARRLLAELRTAALGS
jgi:phospholipase/carboxylesterase/glyoxalase family protein